jgi:hypothetical protein
MTFVYRYYDQAELERQLNARATVPDITYRGKIGRIDLVQGFDDAQCRRACDQTHLRA